MVHLDSTICWHNASVLQELFRGTLLGIDWLDARNAEQFPARQTYFGRRHTAAAGFTVEEGGLW
jgi:hypothetical protein